MAILLSIKCFGLHLTRVSSLLLFKNLHVFHFDFWFNRHLAMMQTVETLNCTIERTETPPYFRLTSMRKASSNSESNMLLTSSRQDLNALGNDGAMKGTIHTKRHSQQDASDHQRERSESLHFNVDNSPWLPRETFHSWV